MDHILRVFREKNADLALVYEEEIDGFTFSRAKRGKKAQSKTTASFDTVSVSESASVKESKSTKATAASSKVDEVEPKRRRSARLSGDKEPVAPSEPVEKRPKKSKKDEQSVRGEQREGSPQIDTEELAIQKKRDATRIALPFADTPVIRRNKEMRAAQNKRTSSSRRSSTGIRGRRASSLIESGISNGKNNTFGLALH
jgi:kinetochore protein Mis13/DSN1